MEKSTAAFRIMQDNIRSSPIITIDEKSVLIVLMIRWVFNWVETMRIVKLAVRILIVKMTARMAKMSPDGKAEGANDKGDNANGKGDGANREADGVNGVTDGANGAGDGANANKCKGSDDEDGILTTLSTDNRHSITLNEDEKVVLKMSFKKEIQQALKIS